MSVGKRCAALAYYIVKVSITVLLVVMISELSKRNSFWGGTTGICATGFSVGEDLAVRRHG